MSDLARGLVLLRMSWRNLRRNTRRTLLTATAIAVAAASMVFGLSYIAGLLDNALETYARTESGHVRIREAGYQARERFMPAHLFVSNLDALLPALRAEAGVADAVPRIRTGLLVDGGASNKPGLLLGLDLDKEGPYLRPASMVSEGRLPHPGKPEALLGSRFAEQLEVTVGDTLVLLGQTAYRSLGGLSVQITAIGSSGVGFLDARMVILPLDQAQLLIDLDNASTEVVVFANDPLVADSLAARLARTLPALAGRELEVLSWRDQGPIMRLLEVAKGAWGFMYLILLLMAGLIIINTMLMTVLERTREFGMLAALGMRSGAMVRLILLEGLLIGFLGAIVGTAVGSSIAIWLEARGIDVGSAMSSANLPFESVLYPDWRISFALFATFLGTVTAVLASLPPALRSVRKSPADALRS